MTKEEKQKEVNRLTIAALDLCVKAAKVAIKPRSKYKRTNDRRMVKIMTISVQIAAIRDQIFIVRAVPRFKMVELCQKEKKKLFVVMVK